MLIADNRYQAILADPPWGYRDRRKGHGGARDHYPTMSLESIKAIPVGERLAAINSMLFLWSPAPLLPACLDVMACWGFRYRTVAFVWIKTCAKKRKPCGCQTPRMGMGGYTRSEAEIVLIGTRGSPRVGADVRQTFEAPLGAHSAKPALIHDRILRLVGCVPRLEMFARREVAGWDCTGLEADGYDIRDLKRERGTK